MKFSQSAHYHLVNRRRRIRMPVQCRASNRLRWQCTLLNLNQAFSTILLIISLLLPYPSLSHQLSANQSTTSIQRLTKRQTLQRFLVEPDNLTVNIGESVTLPCRVSNKAGTLQWTRDGFGLGTDPRLEGFPNYSMMQNEATGDYSLKISSVTLEDDASFQCQIGALDTVPGIRSQTARITVQVAPSDPVIVHGDFVNAMPSARQNQQVLSTTAGTSVELTCEAHGGRPAAELAWLNGRNRVVKKGLTAKVTPLNDGKRFNAALRWTFEPTKADHNKRVTCRSTHPTLANSSLASILLEVKYPPEVKVEVVRLKATSTTSALNAMGSSLHGKVGDTLRVKCIADGNPGKEGLTYQWFKDDEVLQVVGEDSSGEELILANLDKSWNGVDIKCQVTNSVGVGRASVTLNIAYGPAFSPSMEYVHGATSGETVRLSCNVDSNPSPEITWIKVGSSSSVMSSSGGAKLTLRNVNQDHVGEYLCRASVKGFAEISAIVYLRLNGPPKIRKSKRAHNYAVLGESGHVSCLVESVPSPIAITWVHSDQVFTSSSTASTPSNVHIAESKLREEPHIIQASFDIKDTVMTDFGHYNCVVINSYGSDWHVVTLEQQTSFATIVTITSIFILALVFVVLSTIICLLWVKHRRLVRRAKQQQQQQNGDGDLKKHYMSSSSASSSDDHASDNQNIYSTASTRTNSTSAEKTATGETGTIITRSGGSTGGGSPRSSTSSFTPFMESNHHSPAPSQTNFGGAHHQHNQQQHHHHHHNLHQNQHHQLTHPPHLHPAFANPSHSPFFSPFHENNNNHHHLASSRVDINHSMATYHPSTPQLSNGDTFALPTTSLGNFGSLSRASISGSLPSPYPVLVPLYETSSGHGLNRPESMYQANLYQMGPGAVSTQLRSHIKSQHHPSTLPTPPPSLMTHDLDSCKASSIATHV